jgi:hypothetical protein
MTRSAGRVWRSKQSRQRRRTRPLSCVTMMIAMLGDEAVTGQMLMRKSTVLALLLIVVFMTAGMGRPLLPGGKVAISNLTPLAFLAMAALLFFRGRKLMDARLAWFLLLFNLSCVVSFLIFLVKYEWQPNLPVLLFEDVEIAFCMLLWWFGKVYPAEFRTAVRMGIVASIPVSAMYGLHDLHSGSFVFADGMDDKSQAAVLLCCEAYVLIRFFGNAPGRLAGAALYLASLLTISRLPVCFFPAILLGLMRRSHLAAAITLCAAGGAIFTVIAAGNLVEDTFILYNRLSSVQTIAGADSTRAHLELLKTAVEIKFTEPLAFVFGTGPDNFSKALSTIPSSEERLEGLDPQLVAFAKLGKAPLHSTPMQILLDYNIVIFLLFVFFLVRIFRFLILRRDITDLAFACGLLLASTFYSLHNKPYFYLYLTTIGVLIAADSGMLGVATRSCHGSTSSATDNLA